MLSFSSPLIRVLQDFLNQKYFQILLWSIIYDELSFGNPFLMHNASKADQTHEILDLFPILSNSKSPEIFKVHKLPEYSRTPDQQMAKFEMNGQIFDFPKTANGHGHSQNRQKLKIGYSLQNWPFVRTDRTIFPEPW